MSYIHKLFNGQETVLKREISYGIFPEEKGADSMILEPIKFTNNPMASKKSLKKEVSGKTVEKYNTKNLRSISREVIVQDPIYNSQYLLTDSDIDKIVDYYKNRKAKGHISNFSFVELFSSRMFLRKFKEPYKDDKIYEKYILKILKDIYHNRTEDSTFEKTLPETFGVSQQFEPDVDNSEPAELKNEIKPAADKWTFTVFFGNFHVDSKKSNPWSIQSLLSALESTPIQFQGRVSATVEEQPVRKTDFWSSLKSRF